MSFRACRHLFECNLKWSVIIHQSKLLHCVMFGFKMYFICFFLLAVTAAVVVKQPNKGFCMQCTTATKTCQVTDVTAKKW